MSKKTKEKASHSYEQAFMFMFFFSYFGGLLKWFRNQSFEYAWQKCNRKTGKVSKDHFSSMILWVIQQTCIMCLPGIQRWISRAMNGLDPPDVYVVAQSKANKKWGWNPPCRFQRVWGKLTLDIWNYFSYYIKKGLHFALWRLFLLKKKKKIHLASAGNPKGKSKNNVFYYAASLTGQ